MPLPTWSDLFDHHCTNRIIKSRTASSENPYYEELSRRRYNYSAIADCDKVRLVFLRSVLSKPTNATLIRGGRFIWCKNLHYEGRDDLGWRQVSFTVDNGQKRFSVSENNLLCIPSKAYINNRRFYRPKTSTFVGFSSLFCYGPAIAMMAKSSGHSFEDLEQIIIADNPISPGALVAPRLGYFYPEAGHEPFTKDKLTAEHPCGIILGKSFDRDDYMGREFYRVRFGGTTYERVNLVEMEILNEV